VKEKGLEE